MGKQAQAKKDRRGEVIRRDKLFAGILTAEEVWRKHIKARGEKCPICQSDKIAIRIRVFVETDELIRRQPGIAAVIMARSDDGGIPYVPMQFSGKGGKVYKMVRVSDKGFCDSCAAEAEKHAAHGPSWAFVEIDRGPGKDKTVVQVPSAIVRPDGKSAGSNK